MDAHIGHRFAFRRHIGPELVLEWIGRIPGELSVAIGGCRWHLAR